MTVEYGKLLRAITETTRVDRKAARAVVEATLAALGRRLGHTDRSRLLRALPVELRDDFPVFDDPRHWDEASFVKEIAALSQLPAEQTRLNAQVVLAEVAAQEPELVAELAVPAQIRSLFSPPRNTPGVVAAEQQVPATDNESR